MENRSPDAAWVSNERIENIRRKDRQGFAPFCPDFDIEVKSSSNIPLELQAKCRTYVESGAFEAWLIDPQLKKVLIFHADDPDTVTELRNPDFVSGSGRLAGFV